MKYTISLISALLFTISFNTYAEIAVITHPSNSNQLDQKTISRLFLGKLKKFDDGSVAVPINLSESTTASKHFNDKVLKKSPSQLKAYWSKLIFTGKGAPPKSVESAQEMLSLVASNPNIIGYVDTSELDSSVKVIARF